MTEATGRRGRHAPSSASSRGQCVLEYALLVGLIVAALVGVEVYARRGLQARIRTAVDGAVQAIGARRQYEPYYTQTDSTVRQDSQVTITYAPGGAIIRREIGDTVVEPGGTQVVGADLNADDDAW